MVTSGLLITSSTRIAEPLVSTQNFFSHDVLGHDVLYQISHGHLSPPSL